MKKTLYLIIFLFLNLNIQAQKYEFDLLTKYNSKTVNNNHESLVYSNSKNQNYFLSVNGDSLSKNARLYDLEKMTLYNFAILESKILNKTLFDFKYTGASTITQENSYNKYQFEAKTIYKDSLYEEIQVEIFENSKRKKSEMTFVLKVKKVNTNLFPLFRFSCLHPFEFNQNLNLSENMVVESAKGITLSGETIEYKLLHFEEVKFDIQIPVNKKPND